MDEDRLHAVLRDLAADAIPADTDPWESIRSQARVRIAQNSHAEIQSSLDVTRKPGRLSLAKVTVICTLAFVLMLVSIMSLPQGRVWAQQVVEFFQRAEMLFFPLSPEQIEGANQAQYDDENGIPQPTPAPPETLISFTEHCGDVAPAQSLQCQVDLAEEEAGFAILLPANDHPGLVISSLTLDSVSNEVRASYGYRGSPGTEHSVWISQGIGDFPEGGDWDKVPSEFVQSVVVDGEPAEFVQGAFVAKPGAQEAIWLEDGPMARLRWRQGEQWFEIFKAGTPERVNFMDRAGMILLAESLMGPEIEK